ncbi:agmatinase [Candidatus Koribacter versatilis Ellin345]|uniref:Agmatinase n=1 Tax=Koribacter versatilis (strain Ellin345) TaxID=204669 RepID=Q1IPT1_KORVE|nr:agmatinase [Candidatus Koribacter versatilis]ABF41119.1 agmatinase [Candidatus Koribacter versatilis Ellin345]
MNPIALLGIAYDEKSSFLRGPAEAPAAIRRALASDSANSWSEDGRDTSLMLEDCGDLRGFSKDPISEIETFVAKSVDEFAQVLVLGGDHSISFPSVSAVAKKHGPLTIVHFDAHPDLYDEFEGDRFSHACPFARIMEGDHAKRLIQIGIRTANVHQREQAAKFNVETYEARNWKSQLPAVEGPVYISVDLDVLDPAFAPGVSHHEPGGLSTRELLNAIQSINAPIVATDVVELNPTRDLNDVTAMVAAKVVKELAAAMSRNRI